MQEFWFCQSCKSMNRGSSDICYHCHAPKATSTLHTVSQRAPGVVLTPELDEEHREIAWALMVRNEYISSWWLGYVSAALLFVFTVGMPVLLFYQFLRLRSGLPAYFDLPEAATGIAGLGLLITGVAAVALHSVFLGLTAMNTPALGGGTPRFLPLRAGLWWIESWLWAIRGALAFMVPILLASLGLALGGIIVGLVMGAIWFGLALAVLGDPIMCLTKPRRLLDDLWQRLALKGSADTRIVSWWAMAWGVSQGFAYAVSVISYIVIVFAVLASVLAGRFGFNLGLFGYGDNDAFLTALAVLVGGTELMAAGIANLLLVRITIELSSRQHRREEWVLSGTTSGGGSAAAAPRTPGALLGSVPPATATAAAPVPVLAGPTPTPAPPPAPAPVAAPDPPSPPDGLAAPTEPAAEAPSEPGPATPPAPPLERPRWVQAQIDIAREAAAPDPATGLRIQRRPIPAEASTAAPQTKSDFERILAERQSMRQTPEPASDAGPEHRPLPPDADWPEGL